MSTYEDRQFMPKFPLERTDREHLELIIEAVAFHYPSNQTNEKIRELLLSLDDATEHHTFFSLRYLAELSGIPHSTIHRLAKLWTPDFLHRTEAGLRLDRERFELKVRELNTLLPVEENEQEKLSKRLSHMRRKIVARKVVKKPGYRELMLPNTNMFKNIIEARFHETGVWLYQWKLDKEGFMSNFGSRWFAEVATLIKWTLDNPLRNPYDLGILPPKSFGEKIFHEDYYGSAVGYRDELWQRLSNEEQLAALAGFLLIVWLNTGREESGAPQNTEYLQECLAKLKTPTKETFEDFKPGYIFFDPEWF